MTSAGLWGENELQVSRLMTLLEHVAGSCGAMSAALRPSGDGRAAYRFSCLLLLPLDSGLRTSGCVLTPVLGDAG